MEELLSLSTVRVGEDSEEDDEADKGEVVPAASTLRAAHAGRNSLEDDVTHGKACRMSLQIWRIRVLCSTLGLTIWSRSDG